MIERIISQGVGCTCEVCTNSQGEKRAMRDTEEASSGGRVRVRIIHGLNISPKELTYLLQKFRSY